MKTHLISMSAPMVLALLAGEKTCTRRLVSRANSLVDGYPASKAQWDAMVWPQMRIGMAITSDHAWLVPDTAADLHVITPRIRPGDELLFREALEKSPATFWHEGEELHCVTYRADGADHPDANWPWRVTKLAARYCPKGLIRLRATCARITPSTPAEVCTPDEARAEGLCTVETQHGLVWGWRGQAAIELPALTWTPLHAFEALWRSLHGEWLPAAPCWRIGFKMEAENAE